MEKITILKEDLIFSKFVNQRIIKDYKSWLNTKERIIELIENKFNKSWDEILELDI